MKKRDFFNKIAYYYSLYLLRKSFKLTAVEDLYDFAQDFQGRGYYDRISLNQFKEEFCDFVKYMKSHNPKTIVEIGTKKGGSFFIWARYLQPVHLISIDLPGGIHGGGFPKQKIPFMKSFLSDRKNSEVSILLGDSHNEATKNQLINVLQDTPIDFLFIDGDHRYEGVKSDFEMYSPLVKTGGYVGFHDIIDTDYHRRLDCYVGQFWNEIKRYYPHQEFITKDGQHKYGIGVLKL